MTAYTNISVSQLDQDSPITQALMTALDDNPDAICEGADGAPRVQLPALEELDAGTEIRSRRTLQGPGTIHEAGFLQRGTVRAELQESSGSDTGKYITRTRNGAVTTIAGPGPGLLSVDVDVMVGDYISFVGTNTASLQGRIQTDGAHYWGGPVGAFLEGNNV